MWRQLLAVKGSPLQSPRQLGLGRLMAAPIAGNLAESLTSAGRWDEALEIADEILGLDLPPRGRAHSLAVRGQIAVARGDLETAERALHEMRALPAGLHAEAQYALPLAQLEIDYRLAAGDLAWALEAARDLPEYNRATDPRYPWALLTSAMRACADASAAGLAAGAADRAKVRKDLEGHASGVARRSPLNEAQAATFAGGAGAGAQGALHQARPGSGGVLAHALLSSGRLSGTPHGLPPIWLITSSREMPYRSAKSRSCSAET